VGKPKDSGPPREALWEKQPIMAFEGKHNCES